MAKFGKVPTVGVLEHLFAVLYCRELLVHPYQFNTMDIDKHEGKKQQVNQFLGMRSLGPKKNPSHKVELMSSRKQRRLMERIAKRKRKKND